MMVWGCNRTVPAVTACSLQPTGVVLAIGDSITRGYGADGAGYAEQLQGLLAGGKHSGITVVNAGVDGETSGRLAERIDAALAEHRPTLVFITTGGNDFLRKIEESQTRMNIDLVVQRIKAAGAHPVLFSIPGLNTTAALGWMSDHKLYEDLAKGGSAEVISKVVTGVLSDETMKSDRIHPNKAGYARMASAAAQVVERCKFFLASRACMWGFHKYPHGGRPPPSKIKADATWRKFLSPLLKIQWL